MHRIDAPSATPGGQFTEGSPSGGVPATTVTADWLNDIQEELLSLLSAAGIAPVKGDQDQVLQALQQLFVGSAGLSGSSQHQFLPGDKLLQWGTASSSAVGYATLTFPVAWPTGMKAIVGVIRGTGQTLLGVIFNSTSLTQTTIPFAVVNASNGFIGTSIYYIAVGD